MSVTDGDREAGQDYGLKKHGSLNGISFASAEVLEATESDYAEGRASGRAEDKGAFKTACGALDDAERELAATKAWWDEAREQLASKEGERALASRKLGCARDNNNRLRAEIVSGDAKLAQARERVEVLEAALRAVLAVCVDREAFVRDGPRGFLRAERIAREALEIEQ